MGRLGCLQSSNTTLVLKYQGPPARAGGWGREGSRDFIFSLLRVLMVVDQKIPIEQYIPHLKN